MWVFGSSWIQKSPFSSFVHLVRFKDTHLLKKSNKFGLTWSEVFWPLNVDPSDAVVGVLMVVGFERGLAFQKLEAQDTKGPKVDFFVVVFT